MVSNSDRFRSWNTVLNFPENHGYEGWGPQAIVDDIQDKFVGDSTTRTCAVAYCISATGVPHIHAVLEDKQPISFAAIKKLFPEMHIEATKGSAKENYDYINKRGKYAEKGEQVICYAEHGEIKGRQGKRNDIAEIEALINQGLRPKQIMEKRPSFWRYEKWIKKAFLAKRERDTPIKRDVKRYYHAGDTGSGKTNTYVDLCEKYGEGEVYLLSDYEIGGFDGYEAERCLFLDEYRGQLRFYILLQILDVYKAQIHARYSNTMSLWDEVHIATILPPELLYRRMVEENRDIDTFAQLMRRLDIIVYHWKDENGYCSFEMDACDYVDYESLKNAALESRDVSNDWEPIDYSDLFNLPL